MMREPQRKPRTGFARCLTICSEVEDGGRSVSRRTHHGWAHIALLLAALVLLGGCDDSEGGIGAVCQWASDCRNGLLCVAQSEPEGELGFEGGTDATCVRDTRIDTGSVFADTGTGLEWQQTPTGGYMDWESAVIHCQNLQLDGSGWHLPTVDELRSLIRGCPATESGGACEATNECLTYDVCLSGCAGCEVDAGPAGGCYWREELGGRCWWYWTSSSLDDRMGAYYIVFRLAHVCGRSMDAFGLARCVRKSP